MNTEPLSNSPATKRPRLGDDPGAEPAPTSESAPNQSAQIWFQGTDRMSRQRIARSTAAAYPAALAAIERAPRDGRSHLVAADNASPGLLRHFLQNGKLPAGLSRDATSDKLWHLERLAKKLDFAELSRELTQLGARAESLYDLRERARDTSLPAAQRARNYYALARALADQSDPSAAKKRRKGLEKFDPDGSILLESYGADALACYPKDLDLLGDLARTSLAQARAMPMSFLPPKHGNAAANARGRAYQKASLYLGALTLLQPDDLACWKQYAEVNKVLDNVPAVTHALREISRLAPDDANHVLQRSKYLYNTHQWAEAIPLLQKQVRADTIGLDLDLLRCYFYTGRHAEAVCLAQHLATSETAGRYHRERAAHLLPMLYLWAGRHAEAAASAVAFATSSSPLAQLDAQVAMANVVQIAGGSVEAIEWLRGLRTHVRGPQAQSVLRALAKSLALLPAPGDEAFPGYTSLFGQPGFNNPAAMQEMQALSRRLTVASPPSGPHANELPSCLDNALGADGEARDDA